MKLYGGFVIVEVCWVNAAHLKRWKKNGLFKKLHSSLMPFYGRMRYLFPFTW
jgi:hypothetical protein